MTRFHEQLAADSYWDHPPADASPSGIVEYLDVMYMQGTAACVTVSSLFKQLSQRGAVEQRLNPGDYLDVPPRGGLVKVVIDERRTWQSLRESRIDASQEDIGTFATRCHDMVERPLYEQYAEVEAYLPYKDGMARVRRSVSYLTASATGRLLAGKRLAYLHRDAGHSGTPAYRPHTIGELITDEQKSGKSHMERIISASVLMAEGKRVANPKTAEEKEPWWIPGVLRPVPRP